MRRLALTLVLVSTLAVPAGADTVTLGSGEMLEGIIRSIEQGRVRLEVQGAVREIDIREIDHIDFNTPRLPDLVEADELAHFAGDSDAQEMVRHSEELRDTAREIEALLDEIRQEWRERNPIGAGPGEAAWEEAKERFRRPVSRYREVLADLYYHVVGHVDEYHRLMSEATDVYVGVEGIFRVGSSLVPRELRQLPLESYMPESWYDAIFYEGYYVGYEDAYEELDSEP